MQIYSSVVESFGQKSLFIMYILNLDAFLSELS